MTTGHRPSAAGDDRAGVTLIGAGVTLVGMGMLGTSY
jgi:hypothetical protein